MRLRLHDNSFIYLEDYVEQNISKFSKQITLWNKFSLVSNLTLSNLWGWHFNEAFSIIKLLHENSENLKIIDFGAGGGVIGIPLYFYGFDIDLIERSSNKQFFLQKIVEYPYSYENLPNEEYLAIVRGVDKIISLLRQLKNAKKLILFKGINIKKEIDEAFSQWHFQYKIFPRCGLAKGNIVLIYDIKKREPGAYKFKI